MWTEIKAAYRDSARVALARPLLFALPLIAEFTQHVIEYRIGMFESIAGLQAAADDPARMGFGQVKLLSLVVIAFWVARQLANMDGAGLRVLGDRKSFILFAGVVLWSVLSALPQEFGGTLLAPYLSNRALVAVGLGAFLLFTTIDIYLTAWKVGAALGNGRLTIPVSFRVMHGNFWWSLGFLLAMALPILVVHYAFGIAAIARPEAVLWPILAADALVVGYLGIVFSATNYVIARRATRRKGVALLP